MTTCPVCSKHVHMPAAYASVNEVESVRQGDRHTVTDKRVFWEKCCSWECAQKALAAAGRVGSYEGLKENEQLKARVEAVTAERDAFQREALGLRRSYADSVAQYRALLDKVEQPVRPDLAASHALNVEHLKNEVERLSARLSERTTACDQFSKENSDLVNQRAALVRDLDDIRCHCARVGESNMLVKDSVANVVSNLVLARERLATLEAERMRAAPSESLLHFRDEVLQRCGEAGFSVFDGIDRVKSVLSAYKAIQASRDRAEQKLAQGDGDQALVDSLRYTVDKLTKRLDLVKSAVNP